MHVVFQSTKRWRMEMDLGYLFPHALTIIHLKKTVTKRQSEITEIMALARTVVWRVIF